MAGPIPEEVLATVKDLQSNQEISILKLSEPIFTAFETASSTTPHQRHSDASVSSLDAPTPSSLEADLTHYKELFAKLRFSYVEQVTKEKFIRAIVGDPPLIVNPLENVELEKENLVAKAELKALKTEVAEMVEELEKKGRQLAKKYESLQLQRNKLEELPSKIADLEHSIAELKAAREGQQDVNPEMNLPLEKTIDLVEAKKRKRDELDRQLEQLQNQVPRKKKELDRLATELVPLETKRANVTTAAREARRRKEESLGGGEDDLEERGRWYTAAEKGLRRMLEIES